LWCHREEKYFNQPKILLHAMRNKGLKRRLVGTLDEDCFYNAHNLANIIAKPGSNYDLKYVLGVFNSSLINHWYRNHFPNVNINPNDFRQIPVRVAKPNEQTALIKLVDCILAAKHRDAEADTSALEREIDELVYALYGLAPQEVRVVEGKTKGDAVMEKPQSQNPQSPRIFISHSSKDRPFVERLAADLDTAHLRPWIDFRELKVGDSIVQKISASLTDSDYVIAVLSKASVSSRWVQQEMNASLMSELSGQGTVLLPVLIEDCELPALLKDKVYADCRGASYGSGLLRILDVLKQELLPGSKAPPPGPSETAGGGGNGDDCPAILGQWPNGEIRRRIRRKLSRPQVRAVWIDTLDNDMDDELGNQPLLDCLIELLKRADRESRRNTLIQNLCAECPDICQ
jgi:hypothetical protein